VLCGTVVRRVSYMSRQQCVDQNCNFMKNNAIHAIEAPAAEGEPELPGVQVPLALTWSAGGRRRLPKLAWATMRGLDRIAMSESDSLQETARGGLDHCRGDDEGR
jgi:hypothetical protein